MQLRLGRSVNGFALQAKQNHLKIFFWIAVLLNRDFFVNIHCHTYKMTIFLSANTDRFSCGAAWSLFLTVCIPNIGTRVFGHSLDALLWRKPILCTVQIRTFWRARLRPDARHESKVRQLVEPWCGIRHIIRVTWHTHHIIALAQDCSRGLHSRVDAWYTGHSARHTPTKISSHSD